jgi:hypothetical protein
VPAPPLQPIAGDSADAEAVKLLARTHQSLIWDRKRQVLRLRSALREFFPASLEAFDDLSAADALELLGRVPDPDRAARLSRSQLAGALRRANRRNIDANALARHRWGVPRTARPSRRLSDRSCRDLCGCALMRRGGSWFVRRAWVAECPAGGGSSVPVAGWPSQRLEADSPVEQQ